MLEQLLVEIQKSGTLQPNVLAARLNLNTAMVDAMIASLKSMGMLQQINTACSEPCGGCPLASSCGTRGNQGQLWVLTHLKPVRTI